MSRHDEHRTLVQSGDFEAAMRLSGERLAMAEKALGGQPTAEHAVELLQAAMYHVSDLQYAGLEHQEAATALLAVATILVDKVNPELLPVEYLTWLQLTSQRLAQIVFQEDNDELAENFQAFATLVFATADDYRTRFNIPERLLDGIDYYRTSYLDEFPEATWQGRAIVPQMAIDIIINFINTLARLGWLE